MKNEKFVITVSRQFGSLGRPIAEEAARQLGIDFYDRDIVEMTASAANVDADQLEMHDEERYSRLERMAYPLGTTKNPIDQEALFEIQKSIILDIAENRKPCIIVGRCSDYILKDYENALHVFIYASYEKRLENCITEFKMSMREAKRMIGMVDKARSSYYAFHTDRQFDARDGRELMIDSGVFGVKGSVELIKTAIKQKFGI